EKTYVLGMPIGLLFIILLAVVYARTNVESIDQELLIVSLVGGALGAMVSVMTRISRNKLKVDPYADRLFIVLCGAFRPIVGAVVAVVVQCALQADALPVKPPTDPSVEKYLALMLAFAVGFSERWAQDMLRRTAGELGVRGHPKKEKAAGAADREATADAADSI
ncbi:MAG: hypothetical protein ACRD12_07355, partial [Acidimicrobiales bacterium]